MKEWNLHLDDEKRNESLPFFDNAKMIPLVLENILNELEENEYSIDRAGTPHEYVVKPGLSETILPLLETIVQNPNAQFILGYGLTRSGKTLSTIKLIKVLNSVYGKNVAKYVDLQSIQASNDDELKNSLAYKTDTMNGGEHPRFIVIDEAGPYLHKTSEESSNFLKNLSKQFPNSTIITIDVYGRNRGKVVGDEKLKKPKSHYKPIISSLIDEGIEAVTHVFRDAWTQKNIELLLIALLSKEFGSAEIQKKKEAFQDLSYELACFCMGNPYVLKAIIDKIFELDLWKGSPEEVTQLLLKMNKSLYDLPDFSEIESIYDSLGLGRISYHFERAFAGFAFNDMLDKLRVTTLSMSKSVTQHEIDWASWGRDQVRN